MKQSASSAKAFIAFHNDRWWRELKVDGKKKQKKNSSNMFVLLRK